MAETTIPNGVSVFTEIGMGKSPFADLSTNSNQETSTQPSTTNLDEVKAALEEGTSSGLIRAKQLLDKVVTERVGAMKPGGPETIKPKVAPGPAPGAAAAPAAAAPAPAASPAVGAGPGADAGPSANLISDLSKLVKAGGEALGTIQKPTTTGAPSARAQPPGASQTAQAAIPGRRPL